MYGEHQRLDVLQVLRLVGKEAPEPESRRLAEVVRYVGQRPADERALERVVVRLDGVEEPPQQPLRQLLCSMPRDLDGVEEEREEPSRLFVAREPYVGLRRVDEVEVHQEDVEQRLHVARAGTQVLEYERLKLEIEAAEEVHGFHGGAEGSQRGSVGVGHRLSL